MIDDINETRRIGTAVVSRWDRYAYNTKVLKQRSIEGPELRMSHTVDTKPSTSA